MGDKVYLNVIFVLLCSFLDFYAQQRSCGKVMFFTGVCLSIGAGVGISGTRSLLEGKYLWYQVPSGGSRYPEGGVGIPRAR